MIEGYDPEDMQVALATAMQRGYIVYYENVEAGMTVRLVTRPNHIRQEVARYADVLKAAALAHVEQAVAGVEGEPGDPVFEQEQMALNVEAITKAAMFAGFAAADAASRDGYQSEDTFYGLDLDENGEQSEDVEEK
jgi:hypothetical protein